jgi:AcrR family transcriptional regulator
MTPRQYTLGRRAEAAEETRRRITQATFDLHNERGVARTSMKDIAERADVAIGTVYHHFPTYNDAITACGQLVRLTFPPPAPDVLDAHRGWDRVGAMVQALIEFWAQAPMLTEVRYEQAHYPALAAFMAQLDAWQADFVQHALEPLGIAAKDAAVVRALTDLGVWRQLEAAGFDTLAATAAVTDAVTAWLRSIKRKAR